MIKADRKCRCDWREVLCESEMEKLNISTRVTIISQGHLRVSKCGNFNWNTDIALRTHIPRRYPLPEQHTLEDDERQNIKESARSRAYKREGAWK